MTCYPAIGMQYGLQPSMWTKRFMLWSATTLSSPTTINFGTQTTGSAVALPITPTSIVGGCRRLQYASTGSAQASAGTRHGRLEFYMSNGGVVHGGFDFVATFAISSASVIATQRQFVGMWGSVSVMTATQNPSAQAVPMIGFGVDSADTTWSVMHNRSFTFTGAIALFVLTVTATTGVIELNKPISHSLGCAAGTVITAFGTGTGGVGTYRLSISQTVAAGTMTQFNCTKAPIPSFLNPKNSSILFIARLFSAPGSGTCSYSLQDASSETLLAEGTITTDLPPIGTLFAPQLWINNGTSGGVASIDIATQYIETDI